jgi:transcriptional regulator with XRE-family HTH domain
MDRPGEVLNAWRKRVNKSLRSVADDVGCDASYIAYIEKGERTPTLAVAVKLEALTGIPAKSWVPDETKSSSESGEHAATDPAAEGEKREAAGHG